MLRGAGSALWPSWCSYGHVCGFFGDSLPGSSFLGDAYLSRGCTGNSLAAQWLGLSSFTSKARVWSLVGKLRSHKPHGISKKNKRWCTTHASASACASFCVFMLNPHPGLHLRSILGQARVNISIMSSSRPAGFPCFDLLCDLHLLPRLRTGFCRHSRPQVSQARVWPGLLCSHRQEARGKAHWLLGQVGGPPLSSPVQVDDTASSQWLPLKEFFFNK